MLTSHKPYSESCDQNREPILATIKPVLSTCKRLLEIGSGTGQHAVYFADDFSELYWQTSDLSENHAAIHAWLAETPSTNIGKPIQLDVNDSGNWPQPDSYDACFFSQHGTHYG